LQFYEHTRADADADADDVCRAGCGDVGEGTGACVGAVCAKECEYQSDAYYTWGTQGMSGTEMAL